MTNKQREQVIKETVDKVYEVMYECWTDVDEQERPPSLKHTWFNSGKFEDKIYEWMEKEMDGA